VCVYLCVCVYMCSNHDQPLQPAPFLELEKALFRARASVLAAAAAAAAREECECAPAVGDGAGDGVGVGLASDCAGGARRPSYGSGRGAAGGEGEEVRAIDEAMEALFAAVLPRPSARSGGRRARAGKRMPLPGGAHGEGAERPWAPASDSRANSTTLHAPPPHANFKLILSVIGEEGLLAGDEVCAWEVALRSDPAVPGADAPGAAGFGEAVWLRDVARADAAYTCGLLQVTEDLLALVPASTRGRADFREGLGKLLRTYARLQQLAMAHHEADGTQSAAPPLHGRDRAAPAVGAARGGSGGSAGGGVHKSRDASSQSRLPQQPAWVD